MNTKYIWLITILFGFSACNDIEDVDRVDAIIELPELSTGTADFTKYVAVGSSFTAGFTDNALFKAGQQNSFPYLLSQQFSLLGGGSFTQPMMNDNIGGFLFNGVQSTSFPPRLFFNISTLKPELLQAMSTTEATTILTGPFNNLGVPGAKSFHLTIQGYGALNPYFGRMASSSTASVIGDAVAQNPTFFTLSEVGGNDVLGYATNGGDTSLGTITNVTTFNTTFNSLINALTANGAKGAVTNVPYITSLPHFTKVPYNAVPLDAATAAQLNGAFAAYNVGLQNTLNAINAGLISSAIAPNFNQAEVNKRQIHFSAGQNPILILDETLSNLTTINAALTNMRQATSADLILLPASSFIGTLLIPGNPQYVNGVSVPLADKWVLIPSEQAEIKAATDAYNSIIESVAASKKLALVNFKDLLSQASTTGIQYGNFNLKADIVTGGLIGLDGIHLTSRGYAALTNKFLEKIDETYGTNFKTSGNLVNIGNYPTNYPNTLQ